MTTKQASKSSGTGELPATDHRKIEWDLGQVESQPGWHVSGLYRAGCAVGVLFDAGVR